MKNFSLGIAIGATFNGVTAFGSAIKSTTTLNQKLQELKRERIDLGEKFGKASTEATKLNSKILGLTRNIKLMDKNFALGKGLEQYRNKFKESILDKVALGTSIVMPLKVAIDFESAMADVKKVVNFSSELDFKDFEKSLLSLSKTIPLSATELATISASGGQLGIAKENLLEFTTTVAKMSTAFDMSAESAGDSIAKLMNVYGLTQSQIVELGDSINHLSDTSASKASEVVEVLGRIGGTSKIFGLTTVQAGALSSAFLALGKSPEVAATSINALLSKLSAADKQSKPFQEGLKAIGLSAKDLKESINKDAQGALISFLETLKEVPKENQMGILFDLFGAEYSDDIALLVGGMENYTQALENTADKTKYLGSMNREFETRSKTTANNLKLLSNTVSMIGINFGSLLLPALNSVLEPVKVLGNLIGDFVTEFPTVSKVMGIAVVGAIGLSLGLSAIGFMGSLALTGLLSLGKGLLLVNSLFLANPIGLAIAGIALAAGLIYVYWEPIKDFFKGLWESVSTIFTSSWNAISSFTSNAWSSMLNIFISSWNGIKTFFGSLWNGIKSIFFSGIEFIKEYLGWTPLGMIINNWGFITNFFSNFGNGVCQIISNAWDGIKNIVSSVSNTAVNLAVSIWNPISSFFSSLWNTVTQIFVATWENIKNSFNGVIDFIQKPFEDFFNWIAGKFEWINNLIGSTIGVLKDIGNSIGEKATQFGNAVGDGLKTASNFFKVDKENEKKYMVFDEKQKGNSGLNYATLPTDKKDITGNKDIQQTNHINVTVNNPKSTVDVQKGIQDAMANKKSNTQLSDQEF